MQCEAEKRCFFFRNGSLQEPGRESQALSAIPFSARITLGPLLPFFKARITYLHELVSINQLINNPFNKHMQMLRCLSLPDLTLQQEINPIRSRSPQHSLVTRRSFFNVPSNQDTIAPGSTRDILRIFPSGHKYIYSRMASEYRSFLASDCARTKSQGVSFIRV